MYAQLQLLVIVYLQGQTYESCQEDVERTLELFRTLDFIIYQFKCSVTIRSHIRRVHACFTVTRLLHFWQNDLDPLRATVLTRRWNGYGSKSQHRKLTQRRKFSSCFCRDSNPRPFDHESDALPLSYPRFACFSLIMKITCAKSNQSG